MSRAQAMDVQTEYEHLDPKQVAHVMANQVVLMACPVATYQMICREAEKRGILPADLLNAALLAYLQPKETD